MNQFIFKSRWIALAFAAFTLVSVYALVGEEDGSSLLGSVQGSVGAESAPMPGGGLIDAPLPSGQPVVQGETSMDMAIDDAEFVEDEELIDAATGEPTDVQFEDDAARQIEYVNGVPVVNNEIRDIEPSE